jgi:tetratricopeptide (TPR) repeat protein
MRLLTIAPRHDFLEPPTELAAEQIWTGPDWPDRKLGDYTVSLATIAQNMRLSDMLGKIPPHQSPDALVCIADIRRLQLPREVAQFEGARVLLLANLDASQPPSPGLLGYLTQEKFDRIVVVDDLRACHALRRAGVAADWFPGLLTPPAVPTPIARRDDVVVSGVTAQNRPTVIPLLRALREANIAFEVVSETDAALAWSAAKLSIHFSPTTNLGAEPWRMLASGTRPLLPRPAGSTGWAELRREGEHWWGFADADELVAQVKSGLSRSADLAPIAAANRQWFEDHLAASPRRAAFAHYLRTGDLPAEFAQAAAAPGAPATVTPTPSTPLDPTTRKARELLEQGNYSQAFEFATRAIGDDPANSEALFVITELALDAANPTAARESLTKLQFFAPYDPRLADLERVEPHHATIRCAERLVQAAWTAARAGNQPEFVNFARRAAKVDGRLGAAHYALGLARWAQGNVTEAEDCLIHAVQCSPHEPTFWMELGFRQRASGSPTDAQASFARAVELAPDRAESRLATAEAAWASDDRTAARTALDALLAAFPDHATAQLWRDRLPVPTGDEHSAVSGKPPERDLLICGSEMDRGHGTGVLMQRAFPDSDDFVVMRSQTLYRGSEVFGGSHLVVNGDMLSDAQLRRTLRRRLAPYRIRRILCVPFGPLDFRNAILTRELLDVPLATYVMDDQAAYASAVSDQMATDLFAASDLRLAISAEMAATYEARFGSLFAVMPPLVDSDRGEVTNRWNPRLRPANHVIMVGNVWSLNQFAHLRALVQATGLKIDWFGNPELVLNHFDRDQLRAEGIDCRGFIPEADLAASLAEYPFTLVLSGSLDGTENNEWLSRLSLPSRMVFILTKTRTPMLVLGSPDTCAARFATGLGIGLNAPYKIAPVQQAINRLGNDAFRAGLIERATALTPRFIMAEAGQWIWESLAAGRALPAPFLDVFAPAKTPTAAAPSSTIPGQMSAAESLAELASSAAR